MNTVLSSNVSGSNPLVLDGVSRVTRRGVAERLRAAGPVSRQVSTAQRDLAAVRAALSDGRGAGERALDCAVDRLLDAMER